MPVDLPAHVWVRDGLGRQPGVLIAWRKNGARWEGWVIVAAGFVSSAHGAASVEREVAVRQSWVDAGVIELP